MNCKHCHKEIELHSWGWQHDDGESICIDEVGYQSFAEPKREDK